MDRRPPLVSNPPYCVAAPPPEHEQATAPLLNGLLFATYRFLTKLQTQTHHEDNDLQLQRPKDLEPELEPTLGQIFLAGAGCSLASTYANPPLVPSNQHPK